MPRLPILILLLLASLSGCAALRSDRIPASVAGDGLVYVVDRGWHTDISLPVAELDPQLQPIAALFPGAQYIDFGFGDRRYLLSRDTGFDDMLRALFPGPAAMLVTALKDPPAAAFGGANVVALHLSNASIAGIDGFIARSFANPSVAGPGGGTIEPLAEGPYAGSLFFASDATYDAFYTCNSWVAAALRAGGLPVSTRLVLLASQVMARAHALAAIEAGPPSRAGSRGPTAGATGRN